MNKPPLYKQSLKDVLSDFFNVVMHHKNVQQSSFLNAMVEIYHHQSISNEICAFALDDDSTTAAINLLKEQIKKQTTASFNMLNSPLTYLFDELICNIQQHAQVDKGYAYAEFNPATNTINIIIADWGVTIYGSYVAAQKHLDKLGNSDAEALNLAQNGYSVKNLPNAENRGYGISSNINMIVNGLHGEFATLSGNALMLHSAGKRQILDLPSEVDFKGTMVLVSFPIDVPNDFNLYKYTS